MTESRNLGTYYHQEHGVAQRIIYNPNADLLADRIIVEQLSTDALGNEIWVAVSRPNSQRHGLAWDFLRTHLAQEIDLNSNKP